MRHVETSWKDAFSHRHRDFATTRLGTTIAMRLGAMVSPSTCVAALLPLSAGLLVLACGMAPKPLPPTDEPTDSGPSDVTVLDVYVPPDVPIDVPVDMVTEDSAQRPGIHPENLTWWHNPSTGPNPRDKIIGKPGAIDPPTGIVIVTALDTTDPPETVNVQPDGSFELAAPGTSSHEYRLQVRQGALRSVPIDLTDDSSYHFRPTVHALASCLTIEPALEAPFGPLASGVPFTRSIIVRNACASSLAFLAPRLRTKNAEFALSEAASFQLGVGEERTVSVTINNSNLPAETEEVLFIETQSPTGDRRPITLFVVR